MRELKIGNKVAKYPIIQGGMGVGVSLGSLAGNVAKEGGVGIISTAQIGFEKEEFDKNQHKCNLEAIREQIARAKEIADGNGLVGVNVMVALKHYREHVREAAKAGADVIISGAGLPLDLPELVEGYDCKIAPIVSSARGAKLILQKWQRKYEYTADFVVVEGPKAGGHLGFSKEQLAEGIDFDKEVKEILAVVRAHGEKYGKDIPVIVAGGVFDRSDIEHVFELGADGVQIASRFVATHECDASDAYKQAYVQAKKEDVCIVQSPVGMPGRALNNSFLKKAKEGKCGVEKCYQCLAKCNPAQIPYCITKALVDAVKGDVDNGLVFCGDNVDRINEIVSVHQLMCELTGNR